MSVNKIRLPGGPRPAGEYFAALSAALGEAIDKREAEKVVQFPPRPIPRGDNPSERMLSVAGQKIR